MLHCIFRAYWNFIMETNSSETLDNYLTAFLYHKLNYKSVDISESKMPSSTRGHPIEPLIKSRPTVPNSTTWSPQQKIPISSWLASAALLEQRVSSSPTSARHFSDHPVSRLFAANMLRPPLPHVKCLRVRTPDMCIRRALFTLINGPRLWQGVSCSRPDSSDK